MRRILMMALIGSLLTLAGCAHMESPEPRAGHYYCKPDSAVRYRGEAPENSILRPAPPHGSCRHQ